MSASENTEWLDKQITSLWVCIERNSQDIKNLMPIKPKTPAELLDKAKDITRKMGGEVPETEPPRGCRACFHWQQSTHRDDQGRCVVQNGRATHFRHTCEKFASKRVPEPDAEENVYSRLLKAIDATYAAADKLADIRKEMASYTIGH